MSNKNLGIEVTPHGTIERHKVSIESTVMWGKQDKRLGRPAWITPNALRKTKGFAFTLVRSTSIIPYALPGDQQVLNPRVKTQQGMTEQYSKINTSRTSGESLVILVSFLTVLIIATMALLLISSPFAYRYWKEQNADNSNLNKAATVVVEKAFDTYEGFRSQSSWTYS